MRFLIGLVATLGSLSVLASEVSVTTERLDQVARPIESLYPANSEPLETSLISAGIAAEILEMTVRPGDSVDAGDRLVRLDCRDAEILQTQAQDAKSEAETRLAFQTRQAARVAKLAETNIASEELKDTRATDVQLAEITVRRAQTALDDADLQVARCVIAAPFDAIIVDQLASRGTRASIGSPILELVSQAAEIRARMPLDFRVTADQRFEFESALGVVPVNVVAYSRAVDTQTGTRLIRFQTDGGTIEPGVPGQIRVRSDAITLPADFLVERQGAYGVMVVDGATASFIPRPEAVLGQPVEVTDLAGSLELIVDGRFRARQGDAISVAP
jgi:RND family efflux transporter MFP subunit